MTCPHTRKQEHCREQTRDHMAEAPDPLGALCHSASLMADSPRLVAAREYLDADHASATAGAWARQHTRGIRAGDQSQDRQGDRPRGPLHIRLRGSGGRIVSTQTSALKGAQPDFRYCNMNCWLMTVVGQKRKSGPAILTSVLPSTADIRQRPKNASHQ